LLLAQARGAPIVAQAEAVEVFPSLRQDVHRYAYAAQVAEMVERLVWEGEHYPGLYTALVEVLRAIAQGPYPDWPVRHFELRLLNWVGFRPELHYCTVCGARIQPEDQYFSAGHGGVVCPRCRSRAADARPVSRRTLKYLRHLQRSPWTEARRAVPERDIRRAVEEVLQGYLGFVLEGPLRGASVQRQLHRDPPRAKNE
jgi:DNA repair protein RecO (recombination protein O)